MTTNPCQTCGACCASFRVSFYWGEGDDAPGGIVPAQLTEPVSPFLRCMQGTASKPVRCIALAGEPGKQVSCSIYAQRPSTCREFDVLEADGSPNLRCTELRQLQRIEADDVSGVGQTKVRIDGLPVAGTP